MRRSLTILAGYDPGYIRIAEHLVNKTISEGYHPVILDITKTSAVPIDSYHRKALRFGGLDFPGHDVKARFSEQGAEYVDILDIVASDEPVPLSESDRELLEISIESALITYYRTDKPDRKHRRVRKTAERLRHEGELAYLATKRLLTRENIKIAHLPNGRFPHQKMVTRAAYELAVPTIHYEKGETPNGAYVQPYAPQDRIASQNAVVSVLKGLTKKEIEAVADEWLSRRAPATDSRNEFSANWSSDLPADFLSKIEGKKVIGFFTSSQDEFQFLGPEWQLHSWEDQFAAFDLLITEFESRGFACYLRVHPNLATKAHECFIRERAGSLELSRKHPQLTVFWHDNPANTYSLLDVSDGVVVWDSTVGLEASARGIPVWTCATSRYGLVADIRELLGPQEVNKATTSFWQVDSYRAKKFIAYLVKRDDQMTNSVEDWMPWDTQRPPLATKLAAILVSGGNPTIPDALQATLDVWRHRSLAFNKKSLAAKTR